MPEGTGPSGPQRTGTSGPQLAAVRCESAGAPDRFPFSVPAIATLGEVELTAAVTLLVGENGTGKSTFLEALAIATGLPAVGSARLSDDPSLAAQKELANTLRLTWRGRTRRGFFLRAEDFFGFQKQVARARADHLAEIRRVDRDLAGASEYARTLAKGPHHASVHDMERRYGADPDAASHGEAFLRLFGSRLVPGGLFLLDEPEAALSPQSQLALLSMMRDAVEGGAQFVVATHSPILMAVPGAVILGFDDPPVGPVAFADLESVRLVRDFLQAPARYLRHVWGGLDEE